ncbi:ATP-binding cassette domain-containing protein [Parerythrobacter aestuarii]|uniref:ATP-binding cassette domain-containing protein n=1 Tax=Parerythrobacter aestuarii TaxID=3020909 RepID=UPI002DD67B84|nr:ATP-binding cassette domain-containing protein [Parerythrobacter aestuarii]
MIRVRDLHKSYPTRFGQKRVLEGIDFELAKGERLGILGRNGAGKSTLIRLVSGAEKPTSGSIERSMSVSWPLAFGGAFQPQLTGIDNVRFITSVYDQDFARNLAFVEDFAELGPYLREPVRTYSSGMRARLAFAISMIIEFDCFLIDEIGAVGDARFHDRCNRELFEVRSDRAMIIISHDAGYLREHCNRWAILHEGRLQQFGDFEQAYATYKELIGADTEADPVPVDTSNRARMIDSSQHSALSDERFRALVQQGDWARDERKWAEAAEDYTRALALYPYQRSYWTQLGHMEKEQGHFAEAETAYRTAIALGEPLADVEEHAVFVMERLGDAEAAPLRGPLAGKASLQPPAMPDVQALGWLFQAAPVGSLEVMRACDTLDALGAILAAGPNTRRAVAQPSEAMARRVCCIFAQPVLDQDTPAELLHRLRSAGAFADWPKTVAALEIAPQRTGAGSALVH